MSDVVALEITILHSGDRAILDDVKAVAFGKAVVHTLLQHAQRLGCKQAWVLTDRSNNAAMRLDASAPTGGQQAQHDQVMFTFFLDRK